MDWAEFGQLPLLDHRKAAPVLAGARCLDGGVERQQVGVVRDLLDDADDLADALRVAAQLFRPGGGFAHRRPDALHGLDRGPDRLAALLGAGSGLLGHRRHFRGRFGDGAQLHRHAFTMRLALLDLPGLFYGVAMAATAARSR